MLVSEEPPIVDGLLLLSYPLHPPRKLNELRTSHFPKLSKPSFFVHGSRDPFGSITEIESALGLIPADLISKKGDKNVFADVARKFQEFMKRPNNA